MRRGRGRLSFRVVGGCCCWREESVGIWLVEEGGEVVGDLVSFLGMVAVKMRRRSGRMMKERCQGDSKGATTAAVVIEESDLVLLEILNDDLPQSRQGWRLRHRGRR